MKNLVLGILFTLVVGWVALVVSVAWAMHQPPEHFGRFMAKMPGPAYLILPFETLWMRARAGSLKIGEEAPDFTLPTLDKSAHVQLSSMRGKPVVLVFGSYT